DKTLFLLAAENQDQILNTILSRTQLIKTSRLQDSDIESFLCDKFDLDTEKARQTAYLSEGNLCTALNLVKDEINDNFGLFTGWLRIAFTNRGVQLIDFVDEISKMGRENQKNFLK